MTAVRGMLRLGRLGLYVSRSEPDEGWLLGLRFLRNAVQLHLIWVYLGAAWFRPWRR